MSLRIAVLLAIILSPILLLGQPVFDDFVIGAWYPWYFGENIPADSVGSIHSLSKLGFNGVYWSLRDAHIDSCRNNNLRGTFYVSDWFPLMCKSSMDLHFETYTPDRDSIRFNPTAWQSVAGDTFPDASAENGWALQINKGYSGTILSGLKPNYWGQKGIYARYYPTEIFYTNLYNTHARLDSIFKVDSDSGCKYDPLCSLDSLCPGDSVWENGRWVYKTKGVGFIVYPRIRVAHTTDDTTKILCRITILTNVGDTISHNVKWSRFPNTSYNSEADKFSFLFSKDTARVTDIIVTAPDSGVPDTFWIDYIGIRDAFANYMYRKNILDVNILRKDLKTIDK